MLRQPLPHASVSQPPRSYAAVTASLPWNRPGRLVPQFGAPSSLPRRTLLPTPYVSNTEPLFSSVPVSEPPGYYSATPLRRTGYTGGFSRFLSPASSPRSQSRAHTRNDNVSSVAVRCPPTAATTNSKPKRAQRGPVTPSHPRVPAEFFHLTKCHFQVIKCLHHLHQLSSGTPSTISRLREQLSVCLSPAFASQAFSSSLSSAADSWAASVLSSLKDHYSLVLDRALTAISGEPMPPDIFEVSFSLASSWARRQLRKKLLPGTLASASDLLSSPAPPSASQGGFSAPVSPAPAPSRHFAAEDTFPSAVVSTRPLSLSQTGDHTPVSPSAPTPAPPEAPSVVPAAGAASVVSLPPAEGRLRTLPTTAASRRSSRASSAEEHQGGFSPSSSSGTQPLSPLVPGSSTTVVIPRQSQPATSARGDLPDLPAGSGNALNDTAPSSTPATAASVHTLILGDSNIDGILLPGCEVHGLPNGRLSGLLSYARSHLQPSQDINKIFVCLSTLDRRNKLVTLTTALKSLLSKCHCLFPNSTLFVLLSGTPSHFSTTERETFHQFASFVRNKHPSNCIVFSAPTPFACCDDVWSDSTRDFVRTKISDHLN